MKKSDNKRSIFKYSKEEKDINKVLKMNLENSRAILNDSKRKKINNEADDNIKQSIELLKSLGMHKECNSFLKEEAFSMNKKIGNHPVLEDWDTIVEEANNRISQDVELEDLLTKKEFKESMLEYDEINRKFSKLTGICNKKDLTFLVVAIALQTVKSLIFPYVSSKFKYSAKINKNQRYNHDDKIIKDYDKTKKKEFVDKHSKNYRNDEWINMLYQTPPYDITRGSHDLEINMEGKFHRLHTLGHDPILGWFFGTLNILTDCITFDNFQSNRISRIDPITNARKMMITSEEVPLYVMLTEAIAKIKSHKMNLPAAITAQALHFKSDENTKLGLPIPLITSLDKDYASKLYHEGYDSLCASRDTKIIGSSFVVSKFIDLVISLIHGLYRDKNEDIDLYEVKTRKILLISNCIASSSSIIGSVFTRNVKNLDIGSILNTLIHLFSDIRFMLRIKEEFINNEISKGLQKEFDEVDRMYNSLI